MLTLLHLPGFDSCPRAWIESRPPPDFSAHSFASAGIRSMSRCMDRIPGPPVLFCICQDSIEVQEPGSNPGPPRLQCTGFARIRSRSRYMDQILRPDQRGRCHPIQHGKYRNVSRYDSSLVKFTLFCICRDSIHVQVHGSNPGPTSPPICIWQNAL